MTPGCTTCGYAVEVVRSCFSSRWRLFRNNAVTTPGRYVFGGDDTPAYPGWHNLWSRDWVSDEMEGAQLGEDPDAKRSYSLGEAQGVVPAPRLIGSADCIANGDTWPLAVVPSLVGGFDARCPELTAAPRIELDPTDPSNWCFWSDVVDQVYVNATVQLARVAAAYGAPVAGYAQDINNGILPKHFAFVPAPPLPVVIVVAGTDNAIQWITEVFFGAQPPGRFGLYATNPIWNLISSIILDLLVPFAIPVTQPLLIVGHSMGGAVGCVLAARLRQGQPGRTIELLTLGAPRPGDAALIAILRTCRTASLANEGDPVPSIPTNFAEMPVPLQVIFRLTYPPGSLLWAPPPNRFRVSWNGAVNAGAAQPGPTEAVLQILEWAFTLGHFPDLSSHLPDEYRRRLCRPAPAPIAWFDAWDVARPAGDVVGVWPNKVNPTNSAEAAPPFGSPTYEAPAQGMLAGLKFAGLPSVNDLMIIATALVGTPTSSLYVVFQMVYPSPNFDIAYRFAVPIEGVGFLGGLQTEWLGSSSPHAGWRLGSGTHQINLPWDGGVYGPILLSIVWDGAQLTATIENATIETQSKTFTAFSPSWNFLGGEIPGVTFPNCNPQRLGEILFYDHVLSTAHDASVREYLRVKWLMNGAGLATESGDVIVTEAGDVIVTEGETYGFPNEV